MEDDSEFALGQHELDVAMRLLSDGVPLTLLIDLATPPHSNELYNSEAGDTAWLVGVPS